MFNTSLPPPGQGPYVTLHRAWHTAEVSRQPWVRGPGLWTVLPCGHRSLWDWSLPGRELNVQIPRPHLGLREQVRVKLALKQASSGMETSQDRFRGLWLSFAFQSPLGTAPGCVEVPAGNMVGWGRGGFVLGDHLDPAPGADGLAPPHGSFSPAGKRLPSGCPSGLRSDLLWE